MRIALAGAGALGEKHLEGLKLIDGVEIVSIISRTRRFSPSHQYVHNRIVTANAIQGPRHPELGIAMDMSIQLKSESGAICTLSLSFNNEGPLGSFFRYIGYSATCIGRYDDLVDGKEEPIALSSVAVSMNGIELQDREFVAAIREGHEPNSSIAQVLDCYRVIGELVADLERQDGWS